MNIVMIGPFGLRPKGTMSVRALPMAQALAARGHRVEMLLPPWNWPQDSGREWETDGVRVVNIALPPPIPLLRYLIITGRLVRRALKANPDVIHCFKPKAYAGLAAMVIWALRKLGLAGVRLVVDSDDWEGPGGWNEIERYSWLEKRFFAFQERWGLTHCDGLTVASRALQTLAWSLGVAPGKVFYMPNGIVRMRDAGSRMHDDLGPGPTILLYTRFFEFQVERVIEIFRRVLAEVTEARLLVVGKGLFGEEERLLALAGEAGLAQQVVYAGWVETEELPGTFAAAAVAICPCDDTLINRARCAVKLVDLMAAGMSIVADDVGQNGEYLEHGVSGLLVEPGDVEAFAAGVVRLLRDEELRSQLSRQARRRVREKFAWERLVEMVERAYGDEET